MVEVVFTWAGSDEKDEGIVRKVRGKRISVGCSSGDCYIRHISNYKGRSYVTLTRKPYKVEVDSDQTHLIHVFG